MKALDLFAGPGGWDEGLRLLNIYPLGVEWDDDACATRIAAGHPTLQADVAALNPLDFAGTELLLASPPCQAFSVAGKQRGTADRDLILKVMEGLASGVDRREELGAYATDARAMLVVEPLRFALALRPRLIAFEQVPPVLPLWEAMAEYLRAEGYYTWTGKLYAEEYGVPQTRRRAILMASLTGPVSPPAPTHHRYDPRAPRPESTPELATWVSMAEAIGWGFTNRPSTGLVASSGGGRRLLDGGSGTWNTAYTAWLAAEFIRAPHRANLAMNRGDLSTCPVEDGAVLQSFPREYPWHGVQTKQAQQVGNAIPPFMATAVVRGLLGA